MVIYGKSIFWWINQGGIFLEIVGAALIVIAAYANREKIKDVSSGFDSGLPAKLRDIIAGQAVFELRGFGLLALGLVLQFVGGFGPD